MAIFTYRTNHYSTHEEDLPEQSRVPEWDDAQMLRKAEQIGANTVTVVQRIFEGVKLREQAYNAVNAVLKLEKTYGAERLESACAFALMRFHSPRYRQLRTILAEKLDGNAMESKESVEETGYIRGADYYSNLAEAFGEGGDVR